MLVAKDEHGRKIVAVNHSTEQLERIRRMSLYCPDCHAPVLLKAGRIMTPHFAHVKHTACTNSVNESEEHLNGKLQLYNWFKKQKIPVSIEHYLPPIRQRVDLLIKVNHKYVAIEYQCAPISIQDLIKRTNGLLSLKIIPIWIFGSRYLSFVNRYAIKLNTILKTAMHYYHPKKTPNLIFYNSFKKLFTVVSDFYLMKRTGYSHIAKHYINHIRWPSLFNSNQLNNQILFNAWLKEKVNFRNQQRIYLSKLDERYLMHLYTRHLHPQHLPSVIHLPVQNSQMYLTPNYIWQSNLVLNLINPLKMGSIFNWNDVYQTIKEDLKNNIPVIYPTPVNHPVFQYLLHLQKLGYLQREKNVSFKKIKPFTFHKTLDEALRNDHEYLNLLLK